MIVKLKGIGNLNFFGLVVCCLTVGLLSILFQVERIEATAATSINIDGKELHESQHLITHVDGRVYVPVRYIAEYIGAQVEWNSKQRKVTFYYKQSRVELWLDAEEYKVNGTVRKMDAKPYIKQGRTLVPVRFIATGLGLNVRWDPTANRVMLKQLGVHTVMTNESLYLRNQQSDLYWLAKIIHTEARGEPLQGQIAVGAVVLNRTNSTEFPNTVYDVIFDKWDVYYQFEPVQNGEIHRLEPNDSSYEAARRALAGEDPTSGALFFHNSAISQSAWMASKPVITRIGKHDFMY